MSAFLLKIINMSISASWLVLAVLILRVILKKTPKWVRVLLWGFVAVRLICPFTIESTLSLIPSAETVPMNIEMDATPAIDSGITVVNSIINPVISASFTPEPADSANPLQIWIPVASVLWFAGMTVLLLYTAISYWNLRHKVSTAVLYRDIIFQCEHVCSPFVLGIIKPKIYLPFKMNGQDLEHVVAHEQAHIRRKDHLWKPLGFLLLTVHWFNPLMWLAYMLLCRDIELACDEKVIKDLSNEQRADYTQALVSCSVNRRMIAACPLAFGEIGVKERVKSVMNYRKPAFWIVIVAVIVCVAVAVCFLTDPVQDSGSDRSMKYYTTGYLNQTNVTEVHNALNDEDNTLSVTVLFESTEGPVNIELIYGQKENEIETPWEYSAPVTLTVGESITFTVPANHHFSFSAIAQDGSKGNVKLTFTERKYKDLPASSAIFQGEILEIYENYFLVEPIQGSRELQSADRIEVPMKNMNPSPEPQIGDIIEISYNGEIPETYPARLSEVYCIAIIEEAPQWDLIPMVMVDGMLYLDTGFESTTEGRCGVMDGEITSSVEGSETPTENDQSNFGVGFSYQYGTTEGTVDIYMNNKWWIFATEEVRHGMQFTPKDESNKKFYLIIGAEGVVNIEISMPGSSGGCSNADGSSFKMGERIWLEPLDGYSDLRGLVITAINQEGKAVWTASIPNTEENTGFTRLTNDGWTITSIP